jgi:hypothetical protein
MRKVLKVVAAVLVMVAQFAASAVDVGNDVPAKYRSGGYDL